MTDQDPNARIAKALTTCTCAHGIRYVKGSPYSCDCGKWEKWATVKCPECVHYPAYAAPLCPCCKGTGRIPRDFADPANTLKLVQWAKAQPWWLATKMSQPISESVAFRVAAELKALALSWPGIPDDPAFKAPARAENIRDIIAERLEEIADG